MNLKKIVATMVAMTSALMLFADGLTEEPDGVSIKLLDDGGFQIRSIGTGTYDFDDPDDVLDAQKYGTLNAKAAIAKFMSETLATEEGLEETAQKVKNTENNAETASANISKSSIKESLTKISEHANAILNGVVVLKTEKIPTKDTQGLVRVQVGVSKATLDALSRIKGDGVKSSTHNEENGDATTDKEAICELAEAPKCPEGWLTCVGSGPNRYAAVQAALQEGISSAYGELLTTDMRISERSKKMKVNATSIGENSNMSAKMVSADMQTDTLTKTAGFVKAYRIVNITEKDGIYEATLHAFIVNPRNGGTIALLVRRPTMKIADRTKLYDIGGGKRKSGAEIAEQIKFSIPNGLENAGKFIVMTEDSIISTARSKDLAEAMVKVGTGAESELNEFGQGLTPDYSLTTELTDIKYTSKLTMQKGQKGMQKVYKLTLSLNFALYNDRKSQLVKSEAIKLSLSNEEIQNLLAIDEEADLLSAVVSKLAKELQKIIAENGKE